jgi:MFS family permease
VIKSWRKLNLIFETIDEVLRGRSNSRIDAADVPQLSLRAATKIVLVAGPLYGIGMGSYAAVALQRHWNEQALQMVFSGVKVPLLLLATLLVALPSFFVINTLIGLRQDFREALRAILLAQSGLTLILLGLAPITIFVYVSVSPLPSGYSLAVLWNAVAFGGASVAAQVLLRKNYRDLIRIDDRHRWMVRLWIFLYAFVGIQMAYVLRPFIGSPLQSTTFFREDPFENAYVRVIQLMWRLFI